MNRLAALLALSACFPCSAGSGLSVSGNLGVNYDANPGNAGSDHDVRNIAVLQVGIAGEWQFGAGSYSAWQLRGSVDADGVAEAGSGSDGGGDGSLSDLSEGRAALRLRWLVRPGSGFYVPVLSAWISGGGRASGSELRNSADWRAGVYAREQLTTSLSTRLGYTWSRRDAQSRVYDLNGGSANLNLDWAVTPAVTIYAELLHYRGDVVSSIIGPVTPKTEHLYLEPLAEAIEPDEAYGDAWYALKLRASSNSLVLGFNRAFAGDWSLDGSLGYSVTQVDDAPKTYARAQAGIALLKRF